MIKSIIKIYKKFFNDIIEWYNRDVRYKDSLVSYEVTKIYSNENDKKLYLNALERLARGEEYVEVNFETIGNVKLMQLGMNRDEFFELNGRN